MATASNCGSADDFAKQMPSEMNFFPFICNLLHKRHLPPHPMSHSTSRYHKPLRLLAIVVLVIATAIVSWAAWIVRRNQGRDAYLRQLSTRIATSRGIVFVEQ